PAPPNTSPPPLPPPSSTPPPPAPPPPPPPPPPSGLAPAIGSSAAVTDQLPAGIDHLEPRPPIRACG
ncbi:hypothetical protein, partial [Nocardia cyriacigeorgica]|uniref:hypothetical protein n=1 Tax=Nocardia cyriacigeorgica TaxID=135487 RepID=UPI002453DD02